MELVIPLDEVASGFGMSEPLDRVHALFQAAMDVAGLLTQQGKDRTGARHSEP
jgi:hypothetical protein